VATLATGTTLAQAVSIFTAPILYRIYDKEDYATTGLYTAIIGVIGVFSTMQYDHAILLEKEDEDAKSAMWLNRIINLGVTVITLFLVFFFGKSFAVLMGSESLAPWLYLAPITIFFAGQNQIFSVWANRKKEYRILTFNAILTAALVPIISISFGLLNHGPLGLFLGILASQVFPSLILLFLLTRKGDLGFQFLRVSKIKETAKNYKKFPIYSLPSTFIGVFSQQLPVFFLSMTFGPPLVGLYNLCVRMLGLPTQLIGNALSTVFRQRAVEDCNENGEFKSIFVKTLKTLVLLSLPMIALIVFFGPELFGFVFGNEWQASGEIASVLILLFALKMIASPLSYAYYIRERLVENTILHSYILISTLIIFYIAKEIDLDYIPTLITYSLNYSFVYFVYIFRSHQFSKLQQ
jgi:O-antigen/teichoic acid export membrane protein